jgi:hypothetical protein
MVRYDFQAQNNNQHEKPSIDRDEYIETNVEPFDSEISADMSAEIELEMAETIYDMRREFKRANKRLRRYYSNKEPQRYKTEKATRSNHLSKRQALV